MSSLDFEMADDAIYFVPLGGCGIFGANMSLYGYRDQWIMVDCGLGFANEGTPGVDILLPDPEFAVSLGDKLLAIIITHAHEDHIGAIQHLWPRLRKPIYATKFTYERIAQHVSEQSWGNQTNLNLVPHNGALEFGPFHLDFIAMAHSIPEAYALAIKVDAVGTVLHTGDWKIDPHPVEGNITDQKRLESLGQQGLLAVIGDSTNAMVPGHSTSEQAVQDYLVELLPQFKHKVLVTCFSTNVARLHSLYVAAAKSGRRVCLVGRSLWRIDEAARTSGYFKNVPAFIEADEAAHIPEHKVLYVCTGSQGEPRSALSRISADDHKALRLRPNDVVIFSSRAIPGNERAIDAIRNRFLASGVDVITDREMPLVHASGHPYRDELKQLYTWTKPKIVIPVHGEAMQMDKHAALANECGVEQAIIPANGKVIEIAKEGIASYMGEVTHGVLALEGGRVVSIEHEAILTRKRIMHNGSVVVTVVVDSVGDLVAPPKVTALGLLDENSELDAKYIGDVIREIKGAMKELPRGMRANDIELSEEIRRTTRRFFSDRFDRKPQTRVHLVRI